MDILYTVIFAAAVILALVVVFKILAAPVKLVFKLLINAASGFLLLFVANLISGFFNFQIAVNLINCLIAGIFGIPGVAFLIVAKILF